MEKAIYSISIVIKEDLDSSLSSSWVYTEIEKFQKSFTLKKGDECYVLTAPEWKWEDAKDGAFTLVPIFCPRKGAGWADPSVLKN